MTKKPMPARGQRAATNKAKKISEYGGMETYASKTAMKKHEKAEGPKVEAKEKFAFGRKK